MSHRSNKAGEWLRSCRLASGKMSQEKLAEIVGLSLSTIRAHEQGRRCVTPGTVEAIAKAILSGALVGDVDALKMSIRQDQFEADQQTYSEAGAVDGDWLRVQMMAIDSVWKSQMDDSRENQLEDKDSTVSWEVVERALLQATRLMMDHRLEEEIDPDDINVCIRSSAIVGEYLLKWANRILRLEQTPFGYLRVVGLDRFRDEIFEDLSLLCRKRWVQLVELSRTWFPPSILPPSWEHIGSIRERFRSTFPNSQEPENDQQLATQELGESDEIPF